MIIDHGFEGLSTNFIFSTGPQPCDILLVGEAGGENEDKERKAFVGKTGHELDRFYLQLCGLKRNEVRVTNLVPFHPLGNRQPTRDEIKFCEPFLAKEIEATKPRIIMPMGGVAARYFLGDVDMHTVHGLVHRSKRFPDVAILPSYHPAAGLHNTETQALIVYDFQQLQLAVMGKLEDRPRDAFPDPVYIELKTREDVLWALGGCTSVLMGKDTEGYRGNPWGLSFSVDDGVAYVIRIASKDALVAFNEWLQAHPDVVVILHNALHDLPILREMGIHVRNFEDTMVYAYCLCLEPQGLKDLAYRHCGMKMKSYDEITGPAMRKLAAEYLIKVASGDWGLDPLVPERESDQEIKYRQPQALHKRALRAVNDIKGFYTGPVIGPKRGGSARLKELGVRVGKVTQSPSVLAGLPKEFNAWECEVPIPVMPKLEPLYGEFIFDLNQPVPPEDPPDALKRWQSMKDDLEESVSRCEAAIGTLPEVGLDAIEDQQIAINYSAKDAHATLAIRHKLREKIEANGLLDLANLDMAVLPYIDRMKTAGILINRKHLLDYGGQLGIEMRQLQEKLHSDLGVWINPSSPKQVAMVIYDMLGFPIEVKTETGLPSTNDKVLEAMAPLHPSIADITDYRELHKLRSTYAMELPRWVDTFERLHANWKATRVPGGRLACSDPNLMAIPIRSARGNMIRRGFIPGPGMVFVGVDLSQIEMRVLAHLSRDPKLMSIFWDGVDFHTATAAFMWKLSEAEIAADHKLLGGASKRSSGKNCVHPATIISGYNGLYTIGTLDFGNAGDFHVITASAFTPSGYADVNYSFNGGVKRLLHVVTNRAVITCSEDHLIVTDRGLVPAQALTKGTGLPETVVPVIEDGEYSPIPVRINRWVPPTYILPTNDHAYFAGAFTGDGCSTTVNTGACSFAHGPVSGTDDYGNLYGDWRDSLVDSCRRIDVPVQRTDERYIHMGKRNLHGYLTGLGVLTSTGKSLRIPEWILRAGRTALMHFMGGLIDTDGTVGATSAEISMCTKDAVFAGQIATVLTGLGMTIGVDATYNKTYKKFYYIIRINTASAVEFTPYLRHAGKRARLRAPKVSSSKRIKHYVKEVIPAGSGMCVDVNIDSEDHIYITNGIATHNCSFGIVYGIGSRGLQAQLKSKTGRDWPEEECQRMIDMWLEDAYPYVKYYMERQKHLCRMNGYVTTLLGRRRYLPGVNSTIPRIREEAFRQAINHPVQGTASEVVKLAMRKLWQDVFPLLWGAGIKVEPVLQIHDELIIECQEDAAEEVAALVVDCMETAMELCVPVEADYHITPTAENGGSWASLK